MTVNAQITRPWIPFSWAITGCLDWFSNELQQCRLTTGEFRHLFNNRKDRLSWFLSSSSCCRLRCDIRLCLSLFKVILRCEDVLLLQVDIIFYDIQYFRYNRALTGAAGWRSLLFSNFNFLFSDDVFYSFVCCYDLGFTTIPFRMLRTGSARPTTKPIMMDVPLPFSRSAFRWFFTFHFVYNVMCKVFSNAAKCTNNFIPSNTFSQKKYVSDIKICLFTMIVSGKVSAFSELLYLWKNFFKMRNKLLIAFFSLIVCQVQAQSGNEVFFSWGLLCLQEPTLWADIRSPWLKGILLWPFVNSCLYSEERWMGCWILVIWITFSDVNMGSAIYTKALHERSAWGVGASVYQLWKFQGGASVSEIHGTFSAKISAWMDSFPTICPINGVAASHWRCFILRLPTTPYGVGVDVGLSYYSEDKRFPHGTH